MRIILFFYILLNTCLSQSLAKGVMLYVHNDKNVKQPYLYELEKEMQNYDIDMIVYPVDVSRTIGEHTLRIDSIIRNYRENTDSLDIFMVADKEASFVAMDVLSKDTAFVALIT